jgi:ribonuclease HIII
MRIPTIRSREAFVEVMEEVLYKLSISFYKSTGEDIKKDIEDLIQKYSNESSKDKEKEQ